jgi:hypothetical protein
MDSFNICKGIQAHKIRTFFLRKISTPSLQIHRKCFYKCLYVFKFSIYLQLVYLFGLLCFAGAMIIQITMVKIF